MGEQIPNVDRLAATDMQSLDPAGTLHAYVPGHQQTICGLALAVDVFRFADLTWIERPRSLPVCPVCAAHATASAAKATQS